LERLDDGLVQTVESAESESQSHTLNLLWLNEWHDLQQELLWAGITHLNKHFLAEIKVASV